METISYRNYTTFDDSIMPNVLTSPFLDMALNQWFNFTIYFNFFSNSSQIDLYMTSALGHPRTKLHTSLSSNNTVYGAET